MGAACYPCSNPVCVVGERFVACTAREDARCEPCSVAYGALNTYEEYVTAGLCSTRCVSGYYYDGTRCVECLPIIGACSLGQKQTSLCIDPSERKAAPLCTTCAHTLGSNEVWAAHGGACSIACTFGYVLSPQNTTVCVLCKPALCPLGKRGTCTNSWSTTYLDCGADCPVSLGAHQVFVEGGSCVKECATGFVWSDMVQQCIGATPTTTPTDDATPMPLEPTTGLIYPTRTRQHSGMP